MVFFLLFINIVNFFVNFYFQKTFTKVINSSNKRFSVNLYKLLHFWNKKTDVTLWTATLNFHKSHRVSSLSTLQVLSTGYSPYHFVRKFVWSTYLTSAKILYSYKSFSFLAFFKNGTNCSYYFFLYTIDLISNHFV